jgi:inosine-uridine nucleoside N-ribohydrolase
MPTRLILDCDPGHDDAVAILLAHGSPEIELIAITTVAGNQTIDKTTLNARRICSVAGVVDVPIAKGAEGPLVRPLQTAETVHGVSGLDGPAFDEPTVDVDPRRATELLIDTLMASNGDVTVAATGPLTNIALAIRLEPRIIERIPHLCFMGGAIGLGNWTPAAEFNILVDPEAARAVLTSGIPITMIGLEVTHHARVTEDILGRIAALETTVSRLVVDLMRFFGGADRPGSGFTPPALHDACAIAYVIDPTLVDVQPMFVGIETRSEFCDGRTVCDLNGVLRRPSNALVGLSLNRSRFWDTLIGGLARI